MFQTAQTALKEGYLPFVESDPSASVDELQGEMAESSYLFFRHLVPTEVIFELRRAVLEKCQEAGWLDLTVDLMEGRVRAGVKPLSEGKPDYSAVYRKVLHLPLFHDFPAHPALLEVAAKLLNSHSDHILIHPRRIGRFTFPNNTQATTPAHQDHFYIRGSVNTFSCWVPLGDCPIELGGLAVVPGSHRGGYLDHNLRFPGAVGGVGITVDETNTLWHTTNFMAGDALFFHSYTIHKALPNLSTDQLRISTDNRYQLSQDIIDPEALLPHYRL